MRTFSEVSVTDHTTSVLRVRVHVDIRLLLLSLLDADVSCRPPDVARCHLPQAYPAIVSS